MVTKPINVVRISCICGVCGKLHTKLKSDYTRALKNNSNYKPVCSKECQNIIQTTKVDCTCKTCGKEFQKQKSNVTENNFCSQSCAAKYNNTIYKKRKLEGICKNCNCKISASKSYCEKCALDIYTYQDIDNKTIEELLVSNKGHYRRYEKIRDRASRMKKYFPKICMNCGYDKHIEICHIKEIAEFPLDTLVSEVNSPNNLIILCPNCHWELDHGHLNIT